MIEINKIYQGDCGHLLIAMETESVDCCVTSPPYFGLRDYGHEDQIGVETTPEEYVLKMVGVFNEVRRILKKEGTLWLNLGDSYNGSGGQGTKPNIISQESNAARGGRAIRLNNLKPKDLIGVPWMVAFALRLAGWYLRQDIIWEKDNCMPESVTDRCTNNYEHIFLLSKSAKYYFDAKSIQEDSVWDVDGTGTLKRNMRAKEGSKSYPDAKRNGIRKVYTNGKNEKAIKSVNGLRNKRSVWHHPTAQLAEAHFATFPEDLIVDMIKAGCPEGGIVLDPFIGAGTTALVARKLNRNFIGFELNENYINIANKRLYKHLGMFP